MSFHEQLHVVRHHFERDDLPVVLGGFVLDQRGAPRRNTAGQDRSAVFAAPDNVIADLVNPARRRAHLADRLGHTAEYTHYLYLSDQCTIQLSPKGDSPLERIR